MDSNAQAVPGVLRLSAWIALGVLFCLLIDALLPQVQMLLRGGSMGRPLVPLKLLLFGVGLVGTLAVGGIWLDRATATWWFCFAAYLLAQSMIVGDVEQIHPLALIIGFVDVFPILIILPLLACFRGALTQRDVEIVLWSAFGLTALVGLAQIITGKPVVYIQSADMLFSVSAATFFGRTRSFSLFSSGLQFGLFLALFIGFALASLHEARSKLAKAVIVGAIATALVCVFFTLTRAVYVVVVQVVLTYLFLRYRPNSRAFKYLPVLWALATLTAVIGPAMMIGALRDQSSIFSVRTLFERFHGWFMYGRLWLSDDWVAILLGKGIAQGSRFKMETNAVAADNLIIGIGTHIGLVGLVIFLILFWKIWRGVCDRAVRKDASRLDIGVAAFWSTWLSLGMLNISHKTYLLVFLVGLICTTHTVVSSRRDEVPAQLKLAIGG